MTVEEAAAHNHLETETVGGAPARQGHVVMPSSLHSVLAKAGRYRAEPECVDIRVDAR
jgi:hypothetical protein